MSLKKYVYISSFLFISILNTEIIIPFKSTLSDIPKNLSSLDFFISLISNELYTNIQLGTPSQSLDLLLDFNSYHTYIIDESNSLNNKIFYHNKSSTFKNIGEKEFFQDLDFFSAISSTDLITINENVTNLNYTFLQVLKMNNKKNYPGTIGMSVVSNGQPFHHEIGLIYQLKQNNIINNYNYTLVYNKNDFNGKIIIGKNIYEKYSLDYLIKDYCIITYDYTYYWGWNYINSFYGSKSLNIKNIYLKPELGVIIVNSKIEDILKKEFFDKKIKEGKCYKDFNMYSFFYCDNDVKIDVDTFYFQITKNGPQTFFLNSNDLTMEYNNKIYFLMVFKTNLQPEEAYFGYPFFKKFDVIFNQDTRNVGFYNVKIDESSANESTDYNYNKKEENNKNEKENVNDSHNDNIKNYDVKKIIIKILLAIFIILCILFFIYLSFYIYRKIKRKSNEKLYEEFKNISDN